MIGCSGSDTRVEAEELAKVRALSTQTLIAIDLALTHDFDPAVGELDGVELLTLESVRLAAPRNKRSRWHKRAPLFPARQKPSSRSAKPGPSIRPLWRCADTP
ncbi:glutamyl-tRNA reductase [Arthrobacter sp. Hiyo8]|nr:glutamyl-tRNA reductase [Arthrobacter sp. Hiyo8]